MHPSSHTTRFSQQPYPSKSFFSTFPEPSIHTLPLDSDLHTHGSNPLGSSALSPLLRSAYERQSINSLPFESFFSTFPEPSIHSLPSDSGLYTHGSDPLGSSALSPLLRSAYERQSINSLDTNADTHNWITKQVRSIRFEAAAKASLGTSAVSTDFPSTWNDIWVHQHLRGMLPMPNQTQANEPMRYEVCNTSKDVFEKHKQLLYNPSSTIIPGATRASLQSQISRVGRQDLFGATNRELECKKQKFVNSGATVDSVRVSNICNVACNSQSVYNKHLSGKKHAAQISFISDGGPYCAATFKPLVIAPRKKVPKKFKFTQPAWCELCKISCTSRAAFLTHLAGKKHLRNLKLLSKSNNHLQLEINPVIGAQEKPNKAAMVEVIEAKKRKLAERGAA